MKPESLGKCLTIDYSDLIGIPYTREYDCNWLGAEIFSRFSAFYPHIEIPEDSAEWADTFQQAFIKYGEPVADILPCTIMTFCFHSPLQVGGLAGIAWHMGVMVTRQRMITTTYKMGVHIINRTPQSPLEGLWWAHFRGAWRIREEYTGA